MTDILVDLDPEGVATVTLNRAAKRNAVTLGMWRELAVIFRRLGTDPAARVVVLTGAGAHFCAGADISEFESVRNGVEQGMAYEQAGDDSNDALTGCPKPTIAAIRGFCVGGGMALALGCDFRIADATARFGIPAARLGIVYGVKECRSLLSVAGLAGAKEILFTGRRYDADGALRLGLIEKVAGALDADVRALASELAANAPLAISGAKLVLTALARGEVDARHRDIEAAVGRALASEDYREGQRAFREKRPPAFTGR